MAMKEKEGGGIRTKRRANNENNERKSSMHTLSLSLSVSLSVFPPFSSFSFPHSLHHCMWLILITK